MSTSPAAVTPPAAETTPAAPAAVTPPPAAAATTATLATIFAGVADRLRSRGAVANDLAAARAQLTQLTTERDQARTEVATLTTQLAADQASLTASRAQLAVFCSFVGIDAKNLAGKSDADTRSAIETAITAAATEKLGSLGVPQGELPKPTTEATTDKAELFKQFNALTDAAARADFYEKHKDAMFGTGAN